MFKLVYRNNGIENECEFDSYIGLVMFVAAEKVRDEDFVSMTLGEQTFNSINEFSDFVFEVACQIEDSAEEEFEFPEE